MEKKNKEYDPAILQKSDLDTIIKVNNKAIELQTEVSTQYEEIASQLEKLSNKQEEISKDQFKIIVLLSSGILSLIIQVIILLKK